MIDYNTIFVVKYSAVLHIFDRYVYIYIYNISAYIGRNEKILFSFRGKIIYILVDHLLKAFISSSFDETCPSKLAGGDTIFKLFHSPFRLLYIK